MSIEKSKSKLQRFFYFFWIALVLTIVVLVLLDPKLLEAEYLANFISTFENQILGIYILVSILRGLFLIPSTPFVLVGVLLFPEQPLLVFSISMLGILLTTAALYYYSDSLGFSEKLQNKFPKKMDLWQSRLQSKNATWIVIGWSFFPFVPTDLICYIAGIVKMPFKYLILGVIIGESVLVACYIWLGSDLLSLCIS